MAGWQHGAANAEGVNRNEHSAHQCAERSQRAKWHDHCASHGKLAKLAHVRVETNKGVIAKSLHGNWREELLFVLRRDAVVQQPKRMQLQQPLTLGDVALPAGKILGVARH
jgi:hypothetical protein